MIHQYKATLPDYKTFIRIYEIKDTTTLYALHLFLQNDLSFAPDQQVFFRSVDNTGKPIHEYGLFDMGEGSMDQLRLSVLHQQGVLTIHYVFDVYKDRYLILEFQDMAEELPRKVYPRTILEQGGDPEQFREQYCLLDLNLEEFDTE